MRLYLALITALLTACSSGMRTDEGVAPADGGESAQAESAEAAQEEGEDDPESHLGGTIEVAALVDPAMSELVPGEIVITRGDTITFEGILRDSDGNRLSGARWGVFPVEGVFSVNSIKDEIPDTYYLYADGPAETVLRAVLVITKDGETSYEELFEVPLVVKEWPAARVELAEPAWGAYTGSVFRLNGTVITTRETKHATAVLRWSSSDPDVLSITPDGVASFRSPGRAEVRTAAEGVSTSRVIEVRRNPVVRVAIGPESSEVRTGDVVRFETALLDRAGRSRDDVHRSLAVNAVEGPDAGAVVYEDGAFVAERPGVYRVMVSAGDVSASAIVNATPRAAAREVKLIGRGAVTHVTTSDLWIFEGRDGRDYGYTGTHAEGGGQRMFVWDVTDRSAPTLMDSIVVDARVVNDVKVNADRTVAVITREGASNRRNGMVLLDIMDPAHPTVLTEFDENLTGGVHNTWINGDVVYAVHNGTNAMHIVDISDPANPVHLGRWDVRPEEENKNLHDVWAEDGFAYLSYWDDGLIILDVGAGIKGGTPSEPQFVSQYKYPIGNTHTAYRHRDYVFVGDEIFGCEECTNGPRGYIHVVDVGDIENPIEIAKFEVPEAGAHNIWVEDDLLYIAYYQGGLRVVDVSGELRGDLYAQGRQVGWYHTAAGEGEGLHANAPLAWGPQVFKGHIFVTDMNSGLWVVQLEQPEQPVLP